MTPFTWLWVLCLSFAVVSADIEWILGEKPDDPSPYHFQLEDPGQDEETKIEQLTYLLKSRELSNEMKRTAADAAVAAARSEGVRDAADVPSQDSDIVFAVNPSDRRFYSNDGLEKRPKADLFENDDLEMGDDVDTDLYREEPAAKPVIQVPIRSLHEGLSPLAFIVDCGNIQGTMAFLSAMTFGNLLFTAIVAACCAAGVVAIVVLGVVSYRLQKNAKAAADVEYPAYGVTGPNKDISPGNADRRLAQSAQMYHYQHQKQQIIAMERASNDRRGSVSDPESEDDNDEGDYTVYECPGLASTGEMEVKNPLFLDDPTPASPAKQPADGKSQELPK